MGEKKKEKDDKHNNRTSRQQAKVARLKLEEEEEEPIGNNETFRTSTTTISLTTTAQYSSNVVLVEDKRKLTLVLDVDETLVHTQLCPKTDREAFLAFSTSADITFECPEYYYIVSYRPYLFEFLTWANCFFNVVAFSAGKEDYIEKLMKRLDPNKRFFNSIFTRRDCK